VEDEALDDVEEKECVELSDVDLDEVDAIDDVEGCRDEGYSDLPDHDDLDTCCGVVGAVAGGVGTGVVDSNATLGNDGDSSSR